jgi:hypothetical protein
MAMPPSGQMEQQCNNEGMGDNGETRGKQQRGGETNEKKGPRDVKQHLLNHW